MRGHEERRSSRTSDLLPWPARKMRLTAQSRPDAGDAVRPRQGTPAVPVSTRTVSARRTSAGPRSASWLEGVVQGFGLSGFGGLLEGLACGGGDSGACCVEGLGGSEGAGQDEGSFQGGDHGDGEAAGGRFVDAAPGEERRPAI